MEMRSPPSVLDLDMINSPIPKEESINTVNIQPAVVEKVSAEKVSQMKAKRFDEGVPEGWEYEESNVKKAKYSLSPGAPLGAYDETGQYYPEALDFGKPFNISGALIPVVAGKYFDEIAYPSFSTDGKNRLGHFVSGLYDVPVSQLNKSFDAFNYPELHGGTQTGKVYTHTNKEEIKVEYKLVIKLVNYPNSIFPDRIENGKVINEIPKGMLVEKSGVTESNIAFFAWELLAFRNKPEGPEMEDLGTVKGNDMSINPWDLPSELYSLYQE